MHGDAVGIGNDDRDDGGIAFRLNGLFVKCHQKLTGFDLVPVFHFDVVVSAPQFDRIDPYMEQYVRTVLAVQADCMLGVKDIFHHCIRRSVQRTLFRNDGGAVAQSSSRKHLVGHFAQRDQFSFDGAEQLFAGACIFGGNVRG